MGQNVAFVTGLVAIGVWTMLMVVGPYNVGLTLNQWLLAEVSLLGVLIPCYRELRRR